MTDHGAMTDDGAVTDDEAKGMTHDGAMTDDEAKGMTDSFHHHTTALGRFEHAGYLVLRGSSAGPSMTSFLQSVIYL